MIVIKELELKQFLKLFWDRKIFIIVVLILFAIMGWAKITYFTTPIYEASGTLMCGRTEESIIEGTTITSSELIMPSSLAETYTNLIKSDLIVNQVIQNLKLNLTTDQLRNTVELTPLTKFYYQISARNVDPQKAEEIVNEFIDVFASEVRNFYEIDNIYVVDQAKIPNTAINMNVGKSIKIFAGIGVVVATGVVMIMFIFNNTVTNSEQIKRYTKLITLASIPKYSGDEDLITIKDSKSPYAESIKILRTNLQYMYDKGNLQTVAITSSLPGEGKSWLTANLAVAFANSGKRTLIIDADMRRGRQHRLFKVNRVPGLAEYLREDQDILDIVSVRGRKVVKSGMAKFLGKVNKYIKIERIPSVADIIYKDEYIDMQIEDNSKMKSLKKSSEETQLEIEMEIDKPKRTTKKSVDAKTTTTKKATVTKAVAKKVVAEDPEKKTTRKTTKKVAEVEEKVPVKKTATKKSIVEKVETKTAKVSTKKAVAKKVSTEENKATKIATKVEPITTMEKIAMQKNASRPTIVKEKKIDIREIFKTEEVNEVKKEEKKITDFVNQTVIDNLYIIPAGRETMESSELLATDRLKDALEELKDKFDIILVDTPPVSVVADGFIISRMVDTNMIVLKHGNTEINELNKIKNNIEDIGGEVIGTVINKIPDANKKYYHTYYNKKA